MKLTHALLPLSLAVIFAVSGCSTTEYVQIKNQCTSPSEPVLPMISHEEAWNAYVDAEVYQTLQAFEVDELTDEQHNNALLIGDAKYRMLDRYINAVWAYADEQAAILREVCE